MSGRRLAAAIAVSDLVVLLLASSVAMGAKFGLATEETTWGPVELTYPQLGVCLALLWWWSLSLVESREPEILGEGLEQYRRLGTATAATFGAVAVFSVLVKLDFSRGYLAVALPVGTAGLVLTRWLWRGWLWRARTRGRFQVPVLVVGSEGAVARIRDSFARLPGGGHRVVGGWDPADLDVEGDGAKVARVLADRVEALEARAVVITDPQRLGPEALRALSWLLDDVAVLVSPHVVDVAPERVRLAYVAGEPLVRVEEPRFARAGGFLKAAFDRGAALGLLVLLSPVMVVVALAVRLTSPGPVFFGHRRIGKDGRPFTMWKFRSMREDAEHELAALLESSGGPGAPLFKPEDDPRITRVGAVLRRFSLDELPQLVNVLNGTMSLVGPRPQVAEEVALYRGAEALRLRVRPGVTGLWQVSGRSRLDWKSAARLDLYYVENWSMLVDLVILWRTCGAVLRGDGAR